MITPVRLSLQLLLAALALSTAFALDITTRDGRTYKHAKVTAVYPDGLSITHSAGVIKVPFDNLPDAIQKEYGYDPVAARKAEEAKKAEAAQAAAAQRERDRIASNQRRQQQEGFTARSDSEKSAIVAGMVIGITVIAGVGIWLGILANRQRQQRAREQRALLFEQAREFAATVQQNRTLPTVATNIILKPGESAFYSSPSALYETRAVRQYQSGFSGFRVAKGVYVGGSSGRSLSTQEWALIDTGVLTITNKRVVFDGGKQDRTFALSKVVSVNCGLTAIELTVEGRQKTMGLDAANPLILALIIRICCQASDPSNLSDFKKIELQIE